MTEAQQTSASGNNAIGGRLRAHRLRLGLTQMQLATRAGYSERLIRKAEAGETIRTETLEVLAEALSSPDAPVTAGQLRGDPLAVVQAFWELRSIHSFDFARYCGHLLAEDFVLTHHGDPAVMPFSGTYHGQAGLIAFYEQTAHHFKPLGRDSCQFFTCGDHITAKMIGRAQPLRDAHGRPMPAHQPPLETWFLYEWVVQNGLITRHDLYMDSIAWHRALTLEQSNESERYDASA